MYSDKNTLMLAHDYLEKRVKPGFICIDGTAGRGKDSAFLLRLVGERGKVYAFDIQKEAIESTKEHLENEGLAERASIIFDCHSKIRDYVKECDCAVFNFGFLPGGDHKIYTKPETSIKAIEAVLEILKPDGFLSLCIYHGGDTGFLERDGLFDYLKTLDPKKYTVMKQDFFNRPNCPPIFVCIECN